MGRRSRSENVKPLFLGHSQPKALVSLSQQLNLEAYVDAALKMKRAMGDSAPVRPFSLPFKNLVPLIFLSREMV